MTCRVAVYPGRLDADRAVGVLQGAGVKAHFAVLEGEYEVFVHEPSDAPRARHLLERAGDDLRGGVRDGEGPDLKRLKLSCAPVCPVCGGSLALDASVCACPHCRAPVDVVKLLRERYGPDYMEVCDGFRLGPELGPETVYRVCPCGYTLIGLGWTGQCPECGRPFEK